jgi:hypothetical protein
MPDRWWISGTAEQASMTLPLRETVNGWMHGCEGVVFSADSISGVALPPPPPPRASPRGRLHSGPCSPCTPCTPWLEITCSTLSTRLRAPPPFLTLHYSIFNLQSLVFSLPSPPTTSPCERNTSLTHIPVPLRPPGPPHHPSHRMGLSRLAALPLRLPR